MSLEELQRVTVDKFMGLYARGLKDDTAPDHASVVQNMAFNRRGETKTRDGTVFSLGTPAKIVRLFVATFGHNEAIILTCDGNGNIYRSDTGGVLLSIPGMVDFAAINVFSYCLISPILSTPSSSNPVYIWQASVSSPDPVPIRPAAGLPPSVSFSAVESATAGNCDIGVHQFAVCFVTNTGYTTQPGPVIANVFTSVTVTSTGGFCIDLSGIPIGPAGTVSRQILVTQSDQDLFYYAGAQQLVGGVLVTWDGTIPDNTTTSITISFFDTDLAVSGDSLFDLLSVIPGGTYSLIAGMTSYHGRVLFWGGEFNLVRVTNPGSSESIDNVAGFVQLPDEFDGNDVVTSCTLQDNLYFFKNVGIFSVTDNGSDPDTWSVIMIDSGAGSTTAHSLGTINLNATASTQNQIALIADFGGIYIFTGSVQQPPLTWNINDIWSNLEQTTHLDGLTMAIDPYAKLIYIAIIGSVNFPGYPNLLVADYNDGLDLNNIKWSIYTFPFPINAIGMAAFQDSTEFAYRFRIASGSNINKILPGALTDLGSPIVCIWKSYYMTPNPGALNIFRYIRARLPFFDPITISLYSQDDTIIQNPPGFNVPYIGGRDMTREFNFMDEKMSVQLCCNATNGGFNLQRLDVFCKTRFSMRPQV